jgi:hypothetical protein
MNKKLRTALIASSIVGFGVASSLHAQVVLDISDAAGSATEPVAIGGPGDTVDVYVDVTGDGSTLSPSWNVVYPTDAISAVDVSQCGVSNPDISSDTSVGCVASCSSGFTPGTGFDCVSYITSPTNLVSPEPFASTVLGPITFTIDANAPINTPVDITIGGTDLVDDGASTGGTIQVACPTGESCYVSTPPIGGSRDFGSVPVNSTTGTQTIVVDNAQDSGLSADAFAVNGPGSGTGGTFTTGTGTIDVTSPASFPAQVAADGIGGDTTPVDFECTPTARGPGSGTLTIANNADNPGGDATYDFTCNGLAPQVTATPTPDPLDLTVTNVTGAGDTDSGSILVENADDAFSLPTDVEVSVVVPLRGDEPDLAATPATFTLGDGQTADPTSQSVTVECTGGDGKTVGTYDFDIVLEYTDPSGSGTPSVSTITIPGTCEVTDTAPVYNSTPIAPDGTFAFGQVANGSSSSIAVDVFNDNEIGDPFEITSVTASGSAVYAVESFNAGPYNGVASPDGGDDIVVSCNPDAVGNFPTGTLEVVTDVAGTHTYDLTCEGSGDVVTSSPADGGTLNLGTVPPESTAGPGSISVTNNSIGTTLDLSCSITGDTSVFPVPATSPINFSLQAGQTDDSSLTFECVPPDVNPYSIGVQCEVSGAAAAIDPLNFTVSCAGRPLVIPTLGNWGLLLMALMMLGIGGLMGRRMMA